MKKRNGIAILLALLFPNFASKVPAETQLSPSFDAVGRIVTFGRYEQDGNEENGPEEIEWIVLDVKDGKSMLISRYVLDAIPFHTRDIKITWEKCTLRSRLNNDFLQTAFTEEEQKSIPETKVDNSQKQGPRRWNNWKKTKGGKNTKDRIFLLSYSCLSRHLMA